MDILEEIVAHKRIEVEQFKMVMSERDIHQKVEALITSPEGNCVHSMNKAIAESHTGIVADSKST